MSEVAVVVPVPRSVAQLSLASGSSSSSPVVPPASDADASGTPILEAPSSCGVARGRLRAAELMRIDPAQSLRQISARAGVAVGTVRDVRERMRRGQHPVPDRVRDAGGGEPDDASPLEGRRGSGRDPGYVLGSLRRDPSLRLSQAGRRLLGLLAERAMVDGALDELVDAVPAHGAEAVVELMRHNADEWLRLAREVELRAASGIAGATPITGA